MCSLRHRVVVTWVSRDRRQPGHCCRNKLAYTRIYHTKYAVRMALFHYFARSGRLGANRLQAHRNPSPTLFC